MLKILVQNKFKKDLKKFQHNQQIIDELDIVVNCLKQKIKLTSKYKDHALIGDYIGFRECHVKPDVLLIRKRP